MSVGGWVSSEPIVMWQIDTTGLGAGPLVNERVLGIPTSNPRFHNAWWVTACFEFSVFQLAGPVVTDVRIFASCSQRWPTPGATAEALVSANIAALAAGEGVCRIPQFLNATGGTYQTTFPIPVFLMLEYDMAAGIAGATIIEVTTVFMGPQISGTE